MHAFGLDYCLIDTGSIGYRIRISFPERLKLNEEVLIYTYQNVKEDEISLYGFLSLEEYDLFVKLISVKGLGPKIASNILATASCKDIIEAIEQNDVAFMKRMPNIGAKTASQIILDLKGKLVSVSNNKAEKSEDLKDTIEFLKGLGYKMSEINPVITKIQNEKLSTEEYIRKALSLLSK